MGRRLVVTFVALWALLSACGWPQPGFDAGHTSNNVFEHVIGVANVGTLVPSWTSPGAAGLGAPVVLNGRVIGRYTNGVRALNAASGARLWTVPADGNLVPDTTHQVVATGTISGRDVVYISASTRLGLPQRTGTLGAYDAATGSLIWSKEFGAVSTAVMVDGRGFVSATRTIRDANDFSGLTAFDPTDGSVFFRVPTDGGLLTAVHGTVFVGGGTRLDAVAAAGCGSTTCASVWHAPVTQYAGALMIAANGRVYMGTNLDLSVFDAAGCGATECGPLWTAAGDFRGGMAVGGGRLYASPDWLYPQLDEIPSLRVYNAAGCGAATCNALWQAAEARWFGPPTIANGVVYTTEHAGPTQAWPAAGCGAPQCPALWSSSDVVYGTVTPIVADGRLFTGYDQMQTYVLPS